MASEVDEEHQEAGEGEDSRGEVAEAADGVDSAGVVDTTLARLQRSSVSWDGTGINVMRSSD